MEKPTAEEILRNHIPPPKSEGEKNDDANIINAMHEFADQHKPKWISVDDELPKELNQVLLFESKYNLIVLGMYVGERWILADGSDVFIEKATHWMPLPENP